MKSTEVGTSTTLTTSSELSRGNAAWIEIKNAASKVVQVGGYTDAAVEVSAPTGATLAAIPSMTAKKVSDLSTAKGVAVYVPNESGSTQYKKGNTKWVKYTNGTPSDATDSDVIPAGTGFMILNSDSTSITVK